MKKVNTVRANGNMIFKGHKLTIGLDLGDHWSCYCVLDEAGEILLEQKVATTPEAIELRQGSDTVTILFPGNLVVGEKGKGNVNISASEGPSLNLFDMDGFGTTLGATSLVTTKTGESHKTSAASVVLIGKDHKVLWSAP